MFFFIAEFARAAKIRKITFLEVDMKRNFGHRYFCKNMEFQWFQTDL